ncbi:MAG: DNA recombination protein RmuC [Candidatus Gastranaerophilales bacterium]|nr:DNA recombination protein RmuC [Candidatus Gastranaerophilales bacterium]
MEIIIFLVGFLCGAGVVFVIFNTINKSTKTTTEQMFSQMQVYFENIANKLFKENSEDFSNKNKEKLEEFFSKFRERIEDFEKRTEQNFKHEVENFTKFDTNIKSFIEAGSKISHDTNALVNVMRGDNRKQGHWGEIVLEKVLDASGLRNGHEYLLQKGFDEKRPDAVILLPENRCIYIDAKTSFASWDAYVNSNSDEERDFNLKSFKDSTKTHIAGLVKKDYASTGEYTSPDYVLMFIPIESCYSLVFCDDSQMWEFAWKHKIMPVSPSTLLASLKIINSFLVVERQNKNAVEIARICTKMLDKFSEMLKELLDARKKLISALIKLNGRDNILDNIEKLRDLGATINKQIPELEDEVLEEMNVGV